MKSKIYRPGQVVFLRCNPEVIKGGLLRLKIKRGDDGRLVAFRRGDVQEYDVLAWSSEFIGKEERCEQY